MVQLHILVVINYLQVVYAPPNQHLVDTWKKKKKKFWLVAVSYYTTYQRFRVFKKEKKKNEPSRPEKEVKLLWDSVYT